MPRHRQYASKSVSKNRLVRESPAVPSTSRVPGERRVVSKRKYRPMLPDGALFTAGQPGGPKGRTLLDIGAYSSSQRGQRRDQLL